VNETGAAINSQTTLNITPPTTSFTIHNSKATKTTEIKIYKKNKKPLSMSNPK